MPLIRQKIILFALTCLLSKVYSQDSIQNKQKPQLGATYNVNAGLFFTHAIGIATTFRNKHQIELNGLIISEVNPFKDKMHFGTSLNYIFLPNRSDKFLNLLFTSSIYNTNDSDIYEYASSPTVKEFRREYKKSDLTFLIGLGFDTRITKRLHMNFSLSSYILTFAATKYKYFYYKNNIEEYKSYNSWTHVEFDNFLVNDLLAKIGLVYCFKTNKH